ncbi:MAG: fibronectin type III domain-containing protein [Flavobacteriaceae bacterium]|jgi:hypothetical protein|nr:fibronectin type III domain-containing protein [Flavobacteriaceae bacterium]
MPNIRRTFVKGVMNKDVDERLLDDGYFRHAENVVINTSEGSDVGAIEKCLSNKQLTFLDLGSDINVVGSYSDEAKKKLYWWVVSAFNKYVFEYDLSTKAVYKLLHESRLKNEDFILRFNKNTQITGIGKILSEDIKKDMLVWTDNVGEICSINIERSKTYDKNGFTKEDIFLIKKPPVKAPISNLIYIKTDSNNIEERFISFAYRYKYLDGEYSALSPFSNYSFEPKGVEIDYDTQENNGMINRYNGVQVSYNSGGKQVKEIQVIAKESRSNNCYIIETFNKKKLSITDDSIQSIIYSNNKLYKVLPEKELFKEFDNVPRKAKALTVVGNRLVFGNYTEGYHMVDSTGADIKPDFNVSVKSYDIGKSIEQGNVASYNNKYLVIKDSKTFYKKGYSMNLLMTIINDSGGSLSQDKTMIDTEFFYDFKKDYTTLKDLITESDFIDFISYVNDFIAKNITNYKDYESTSALKKPVTIEAKYDDVERELFFEVKFGWIYYIGEDGKEWLSNLYAKFSNNSIIKLNAIGSFKSAKTNRDYEVAIIYEDDFKRSSTAITCLNNSTHIGIERSIKVNKLEVSINHRPPAWAKTYRLAVKSTANTYETIYISVYFPYEGYVYCKLEGTSKDKVKEGDTLILKKDSGKEASSVLTVKVLERAWKDKDFLKGNKDQSGNDIVEPEGIYIKIKPVGFVMDESKFNTVSENTGANSRSSSTRVGNNDYARIRTKPFSESDGSPLKLNQGSVIQVWIKSAHCPDAGWQENIFSKTYNINKLNYDFKQWYDDEIGNKAQLWGNEGNSIDDYKPFINIDNNNVMTIISTKRHLSGNRASYLDISIVVRQNNGIYIFETQEEKKVDVGIFYKTSQVFHIINGRHSGENPNMPIVGDKIKLELDFHNCFAFGNSVESYKIKDNFNANSLGLDLMTTATSEDDYAEITRYSDLTYSEAFIESTGINGINSFNRSLLNWKELDKGNGWVQKIVSRDSNLLVFQTEKVGQVMFGKDVMYGADGAANITKVPYILGEYVAYSGEYGMSHPESFEMEGNRVYWIDAKRGHVLRLSNNGITPITYGMEGFFRDELSSKSDWKILGGYDPYTKLYNITFFERNQLKYVFDSNTEIIKFKETEAFKYDLGLGKLNGDAKLQYNITDGRATIEAIVDGRRYVESNVSGIGEMLIRMEKVSLQDLLLETTITPVTDEVSYTIKNIAPQGTDIGITIIVISEEAVYDVSALVGFKWGQGQYYYNDVSLDTKTTNLFLTEIGKQGIGKFIGLNSLLNMTVKSDKKYNYDKDHIKMRYLSSDTEYKEEQLSEIIDRSMEVYLTDEKEGDVNIQISNVIESRPEKFKYLIFEFKKTDIDTNKLLPPASAKILSAVENIANLQIIYGNNQKEVVSYNIRYRSKSSDEWLDYFVVEKTKEESVIREFKLKIPAEDALFVVASVDREGLTSEYINFE